MSEHQRDSLGICIRCGAGMTAADVVDGEKPCTTRPIADTPAPVLPDVEIGQRIDYWSHCLEKSHGISTERFAELIDAVTDRAKREERRRAADWLMRIHDEAVKAGTDSGYTDGLYQAIRALQERRYA